MSGVAKDPVVTGLALGALTGGLTAGAGASIFNSAVGGAAIGGAIGVASKSLFRGAEDVGRIDKSPAPSRAESMASAQGRSSAEERRRRRQRLQAGGALGVANTSEARLGA